MGTLLRWCFMESDDCLDFISLHCIKQKPPYPDDAKIMDLNLVKLAPKHNIKHVIQSYFILEFTVEVQIIPPQSPHRSHTHAPVVLIISSPPPPSTQACTGHFYAEYMRFYVCCTGGHFNTQHWKTGKWFYTRIKRAIIAAVGISCYPVRLPAHTGLQHCTCFLFVLFTQ